MHYVTYVKQNGTFHVFEKFYYFKLTFGRFIAYRSQNHAESEFMLEILHSANLGCLLLLAKLSKHDFTFCLLA